jgi:hypothetical protein
MAQGQRAIPYLVDTETLPFARLHAGVMQLEGNTRWFIGADRDLTDRLNVCADYTNGDENYSSVGAGYTFSDCTSVFAGALFPNAGGDTEFTVHLIFCGSYRKTADKE